MGADDDAVVLAAGHLFDHAPTRPLVEQFLRRDGHHLILAFIDGQPAGFISGVEVDHPDKPTEMLLYELGVDTPYRRRGIGLALVEALKALARDVGCSGMWVPVEQGNDVATALYRATGADEPEPGTTLWWPLA